MKSLKGEGVDASKTTGFWGSANQKQPPTAREGILPAIESTLSTDKSAYLSAVESVHPQWPRGFISVIESVHPQRLTESTIFRRQLF
jgi:hypothetical protein